MKILHKITGAVLIGVEGRTLRGADLSDALGSVIIRIEFIARLIADARKAGTE